MSAHSVVSSAVRIHEFGGPEVLKTDAEVKLPPLADKQVLIQVFAVGINPQETYLRAGQYPVLPKTPFTPGKDFAGVVVESTSQLWAKGARVFGYACETGAYAQHLIAGERHVFALPDAYSFDAGAALGIPFYTAWRALMHDGRARRGQSLLVRGATGGVGSLIVQLARHIGMKPIVGTAGSDAGLTALRKGGYVDAVANHRAGTDHLDVDELRNLEGLARHPFAEDRPAFDVIIEMQAQQNLNVDVQHLNRKGTIVVVGNKGMEECPVNFRGLMQVEGTINAFMGHFDELKAEMDAELQRLLTENVLKPAIGKVFTCSGGLEDLGARFAAAHEEVAGHGEGTTGRLVVRPWGDDLRAAL